VVGGERKKADAEREDIGTIGDREVHNRAARGASRLLPSVCDIENGEIQIVALLLQRHAPPPGVADTWVTKLRVASIEVAKNQRRGTTLQHLVYVLPRTLENSHGAIGLQVRNAQVETKGLEHAYLKTDHHISIFIEGSVRRAVAFLPSQTRNRRVIDNSQPRRVGCVRKGEGVIVAKGAKGSGGIYLGFRKGKQGSRGKAGKSLFEGLVFVPQRVYVAIMYSVVRYGTDAAIAVPVGERAN